MGIRKPRDDSEKREEIKKEKPKPDVKKKKIIEGVRGIVRVAEIDLDGTKKIPHALLKVKGIGHSLARPIVLAAGLDQNLLIGSLTDEQIKKLEDVIKNPFKYGIPYHMLNRRFDPATGEHAHVVSSALVFAKKSDIDFMKKIRCYKGVRHQLGLPVRGQRTRSSFRTGARVGVAKGLARAAMKAPARPAGPVPAKPVEAKPAEKTEAKKEQKK